MDMNYADKVIAYVRKIMPEYIYKEEDFVVVCDGVKCYIGYWNEDFPVKKPTQELINLVTEQELINTLEKDKKRMGITALIRIDELEAKLKNAGI